LSDDRPSGSVTRMLIATASLMSARRTIARYWTGLVPSMRQAPEPLAGCAAPSSASVPSKAMIGGSAAGAPMRVARMAMRCEPTGVFFLTAALDHSSRTSGGSVPGHCIETGDRSGGVGGGTTTHALLLAGDRAASTPRNRSSPDHATARYQTRFQDP